MNYKFEYNYYTVAIFPAGTTVYYFKNNLNPNFVDFKAM